MDNAKIPRVKFDGIGEFRGLLQRKFMLSLELQEMHIYFHYCHEVFDVRLFRYEHH